LIFTACGRRDSYGSCDLYISFRRNGKWSTAKNLGPQLNSEKWDAQPYMASDNKTLYFSSDRPGGKGGRDIWTSTLGKEGWSKPQNLGPVINTKKNEESPFLHPDNSSFYFRSNGHIGLGDYDIFLSQWNKPQFTEPKNLGYPINTKGSEGALFVELNGNKAYFASDALTDGANLDILSFELPEALKPKAASYIKLKVVDDQTGEGIVSQVELVELSSNNKNVLRTDDKGVSLSTITPGNYSLTINKASYVFHSEHIELSELRNASDPFIYEVRLQKIKQPVVEAPKPIILKNVFFETGSAELLSESDFEISKLYDLLSDNNEIKIKIVGHTDNVGQDADNLRLSEQRAKSVYEALIIKGINRTRLSYEGKGETMPIASNDTAEGRKQNRRTEFFIIN